MPLQSTRGAGSAKGFGLTSGGAAPIDVDYLVVAGGGGGGVDYSGGGGAGGYRTSFPGGTKITLEAGTPYSITVGAGGTVVNPDSSPARGSYPGSDSIFSTITSTGGGSTGTPSGPLSGDGRPGGSGSGGWAASGKVGGTGNSPPTSPPQGNNGGNSVGGTCAESAGGGGGAGSVGGNAQPPIGLGGVGGDGAGVPTTFVPSSYGTPGPSPTVRYFAGGGSGMSGGPNSSSVAAAPFGGGGTGGNLRFNPSPECSSGSPKPVQTSGTVNTGGGGGGVGPTDFGTTGVGGSGIVVINAPNKGVLTVTPATNITLDAPDGNKLAIFTVSGTIKQG